MYKVLIILLPIQCVPSITLTYYYGDGSYFTGSVDGEGRPSDGVFYSSKNTMSYNGSYVSGLYHGNGSWYGEGGEEYHGQFRRGGRRGALGAPATVLGLGVSREGAVDEACARGEAEPHEVLGEAARRDTGGKGGPARVCGHVGLVWPRAVAEDYEV